MEDFLYDIKISSPEDVITLFKTLKINEYNSVYIYNSMGNPCMMKFIKEITEPFIKYKISSAFFHIIDGWSDYWINLKIKDKTVIKNTLISFIRTDKIILKDDDNIINFLKTEFGINYYAEIMMG